MIDYNQLPFDTLKKLINDLSCHDNIENRLEETIKILRNIVNSKYIAIEHRENDSAKLLVSNGEKFKKYKNETILYRKNKSKVVLIHDIDLPENNLIVDTTLFLLRNFAESFLKGEEINNIIQALAILRFSESNPEKIASYFNIFLDSIRKLISVDYISLWLTDEGNLVDSEGNIIKTQILIATCVSGIKISELTSQIISVQDSLHPIAVAVQKKEPQLFDDLLINNNYYPNKIVTKLKLNTLYAIPLEDDNRTIGVLNIYSKNYETLIDKKKICRLAAKILSWNITEAELKEKSKIFDNITNITKFDIGQHINVWSELTKTICQCLEAQNGLLFLAEIDKNPNWQLKLVGSTENKQNIITDFYTETEIINKIFAKHEIARILKFDHPKWGIKSKNKDPYDLPKNAIFIPIKSKGLLCLFNKKASGLFSFFSRIEEKAFIHLEKIISAYIDNKFLIDKYISTEEAKETYLMTLRHEIIGPLDMITNDSEWFFRNCSLTEDKKKFSERIWDQIQENIAIISMLARGSNALDKNLTIRPTKTNLTESVIKPLVNFFNRQAKKQSIIINLDFLGLPRIEADQSYTKMVFYNLIRNAIKYSDPNEKNKSIRIFCPPQTDLSHESNVSVIVSDNGIGIDKDEADKIFNKFFRGHKAVAMNTTGSGLGLAISRNIMIKQGGNITIKSYSKPTEIALTFRIFQKTQEQ